MRIKQLPDLHGCYSLLSAIVHQARADAKHDPSAVEFLQIINAPLNVECRRQRVMKERKKVKA